ncbi:Peptidase S8/S53 domain [Sesbania bispinosa]|nr:Peptidase S8/S53 domain [Sesbania bispinosa]
MAKHNFLLNFFLPFILLSNPLVCDASESANSKLHIIYMGALPRGEYSPTSHHLSLLQQVIDNGDIASHFVRSYKRSFNGFVAKLNDQQREKLANMEGVVSVFPSKTLHLQTTRSWDFVGLCESIKRQQKGESDVLIRVIDTGIWPESESFSDAGFGPIPTKWRGICEGGGNITCNRKIIGARNYDSRHVGDGTARDREGHGTHTASTAAGNEVKGVSFYGLAEGTARGGVPSSRIAAYKVCQPDSGCSGADVLSAFDDAIADGVDIITISLGSGSASDFVRDSIAIGSFHAMEKGVLTVHSAGNKGPDPSSVSSVAPWLLSVAATTIDRQFIDKVTLGNGKTLWGRSVNTIVSNGTKVPIVVRNSDDKKRCTGVTPENCDCVDSELVKGKIVLCEGFSGTDVVYQAGAFGLIINNKDNLDDVSFVTYLPSLSLDSKDFDLVKSYTNSTKYPQAEILESEIFEDHNAPKVASFSSRGPNPLVSEILKPDISAPGVDILAAFSPEASPSESSNDKRMMKYNILSGTSMSCPHVAGISAYVKSFHPDWSPAAIKSAIMTTAQPLNGTYDMAGEFAYGAGNVNPQQVIDPGLVYDISKEDYVQMLCNYGYDAEKIKQIARGNSTCHGASQRSLVKDINYPALVIPVEPLKPFIVKVNRTVTNVGFPSSCYKATIFPNSKLNFTVEPELLSFKSLNEKQSFVVTVVGGAKPKETVFSSSLIWSDGTHSVRSPIIVL